MAESFTDFIPAPVPLLATGPGHKERNAPIILHSADISAGNSGGPLVDSCGRAVGINTFIATNQQATKANYALGASWLAAFLRSAKTPIDWRADACI